MNRFALQCVRLAQRGVSTSAVRPSAKGEVHPGYIAIREKYKKFQVEDGVPIHLKGGPLDRVLYIATMVGCGLGLVGCFDYYYRASFPKKE